MHGNMMFSTHYILGTPQQSGGLLVCSVEDMSFQGHRRFVPAWWRTCPFRATVDSSQRGGGHVLSEPPYIRSSVVDDMSLQGHRRTVPSCWRTCPFIRVQGHRRSAPSCWWTRPFRATSPGHSVLFRWCRTLLPLGHILAQVMSNFTGQNPAQWK